MDVPYLLAIQLDSYREFLQAGATKEQFRDIGLHAAFKSRFPDYQLFRQCCPGIRRLPSG